MSELRCPVCDSRNVQVDYRVAVVDQGTYVYPATCECGERLALPLEPGEENKMVKVRSETTLHARPHAAL